MLIDIESPLNFYDKTINTMINAPIYIHSTIFSIVLYCWTMNLGSSSYMQSIYPYFHKKFSTIIGNAICNWILHVCLFTRIAISLRKNLRFLLSLRALQEVRNLPFLHHFSIVLKILYHLLLIRLHMKYRIVKMAWWDPSFMISISSMIFLTQVHDGS